MTEKELIQKNIEEFSRLQKYMILTDDKTSAAYLEMKDRYIELKIILTSFGIGLTELDKVKEQLQQQTNEDREYVLGRNKWEQGG